MSHTILTMLNEYVSVHSYASGTEGADVHFFKVVADSAFDTTEFIDLFRAWVEGGSGAFDVKPEWDRIKGGPSYIEWGYLLGSQDIALRFMGLGELAGLWTVVTPATLHITGEEADKMAGAGFVMTAGLKPGVIDGH